MRLLSLTLIALVCGLGWSCSEVPAGPGAGKEGEASPAPANKESGFKPDMGVPDESNIDPDARIATVAGGCFWCVEETFAQVEGVLAVVSGYAGGKKETANYKMVLTGLTKHAEAVQVYFDPEVITYGELIDHFWHAHDPTTKNRQGNDIGPQYRSVIFFHDEEQQKEALASRERIEKKGYYPNPIVTEIVPFTNFFVAEEYHQNYYRLNPDNRYLQNVLVPKLRKLGQEVIE